MAKKKNIINMIEHRYGLFMSENSMDLDILYGRSYLETDNVQEITVYKINVIDTKSHNLYGQAKAKDKKFFNPISLKAFVSVDIKDQENYAGGIGIVRDDTGSLNIRIYLKELEEKNIEIDRGDIIKYNLSGYKDRYFEVESADNVTDKTERSFGGFYIYWKQVIAVPVKEDTVPFLNETSGDIL